MESILVYYERLYSNLDLRLLEDVLSPAPGGYFMAAIHGQKDPHLFFIVDPRGVEDVAPEEVALMNWSSAQEETTFLLAFHRAAEFTNGIPSGDEHNTAISLLNEDLDTTIEKNGSISAVATVEVRAEQEGAAVVPLDLYPTLRVSNVASENGEPLDYIQEKKEDDPGFGVVLAKPLKKGETTRIKITYAGKDVIRNEGNANYYPMARESWYPNSFQGFGNYATYHMVFHVPKGLQLIATGNKVGEHSDAEVTTSEWKTDVPLPVAGFNLGDFTEKEGSVPYKTGGSLSIDAYANSNPPDIFSTIYDAIDGPGDPQRRIHAAQCRHRKDLYHVDAAGTAERGAGRSANLHQLFWRAAVFTCRSDSAVRLRLRAKLAHACVSAHLRIPGSDTAACPRPASRGHVLENGDRACEVAHQWWGQTVGFRSYRDQWMSEGFAHESASIFLLLTRPKPTDYLEFWKEQRRLITEKSAMGFRPIDVGPVT